LFLIKVNQAGLGTPLAEQLWTFQFSLLENTPIVILGLDADVSCVQQEEGAAPCSASL
jgi:hypothetical protein